MKKLLKVTFITLALGMTVLPLSITPKIDNGFHSAEGRDSDEDYPSPIVKF